MCSTLKGFLLIVPLKATRDSQRFRFWLCGVMGSNHEKNGGRKSHDTLPEMLVFILSSLNQEKKLSHGILMFYLLNDVAIEDCKYLFSITEKSKPRLTFGFFISVKDAGYKPAFAIPAIRYANNEPLNLPKLMYSRISHCYFLWVKINLFSLVALLGTVLVKQFLFKLNSTHTVPKIF